MTVAQRILGKLMTDGVMLTRQLATALDVDHAYVRAVCRCLARKQLIRSIEGLHEITALGSDVYQMRSTLCSGLRKGHAASSAGRHLRQRAWFHMRLLVTFGLSDVLSRAADGTEGMAENNLRYYCSALVKARILGVTRRTGQYVLLSDTGPLAPAYNRQEKTVTDRNTGEVHDIGGHHERRE